jgi:ubiquitin C-terminal hydrolase
MDLKAYNPKYSLAPAGFNNLGVTCYYNALLQSLLSCTSFVEEMIIIRNQKNELIIKAFKELILKLKNPLKEDKQKIAELGPQIWKLMIQKIATTSHDVARFAVGQQCAGEGFTLLLDTLDEYYEIQNLFLHRRKNKLFCHDCKTFFSSIDEMNNIFTVEVEVVQEIETYRNINEFLLRQRNKVDADCLCSRCNVRGEKEKISTLTMVSEILFVLSKKYRFENGQGTKINVKTNFPERLTFKTGNNSTLIYTAVAQIEHIGGLNGGHYYTICRRQNKWYCIDDNSVTEAQFNPNINTYIVIYHFLEILRD